MQNQKNRYGLDFLSFERVDSLEQKFRYLDLTKRESFFDVLSADELEKLDPDLAKQAQIPILNSQQIETRGLVSRTVIPVRNDFGEIIGFLDGGLLLNNSTTLVDQIRDLIYPSHQDQLRPTAL